MHICSNQEMKRDDAHTNQKGNLKAHTSTLKSSTMIHLFLRKSIIHCHNQSPHPMSNATILALLVILVKNYCLIVLEHTPNVLLIRAGNANDQK